MTEAAFLLEVGTEELPADFIRDALGNGALTQWESRIPQTLAEQGLSPTGVEVYGTPRRLAVLIRGLPSHQPNREEEIKGPPAQAAYKEGKPTKAAEGFARKQGVTLAELEVRETEKGAFVFVVKKIPGRPVTEILTELVPQWIFGLEGRRFMTWGDGDLKFPRPIRWLVALWDDQVLPIEWINGSEIIKSDRISYGHRVLHPQPIEIPQATDYVKTLEAAYVRVDDQYRQEIIKAQIESAAKTCGGYPSPFSDTRLEEVTNLVEWPTAVVGKIEPEFLSLPALVVKTVMIVHQRYFPVYKSDDSLGELLPYFITISNGDPSKSDIIAAGNERVIRARLADAQFFYKTDLAAPLESYLPKLEKVTFQDELGSVRQKVDRIEKIAAQIAAQLDVSATERTDILRAARLCKADLVTQMVYEFPELQGEMGRNYAVSSGESDAVATAISEHYLPTGTDHEFPKTLTGRVVGLADRLDTLVSIFGLGLLPTGSSDPFALRRAANSVINITWDADFPINLYQLLQDISADFVAAYPGKTSPIEALQEFFLQRIRALLQDPNLRLSQKIPAIDYDLVNAVLGENDPEYTERALNDLLDVRDRAVFLQDIRHNGWLNRIYETVNRSTRLSVQGTLAFQQFDPTSVVNPARFEKSSEPAFYQALVELVPKTEAAKKERDYQTLVQALADIAPTVSLFFDDKEEGVLVMADDPEIRQNRLNLLGLLRNHARVLADFGAIVKS